MTRLILLLAALALSACTLRPAGPPPPGSEADIAALSRAIAAMDASIDPSEANRAARIAYTHTYSLALSYQITDAPLVHNAKVNSGRKPRGLCWHWAQDMETRLNAEGFETLDMQRAIANADSAILIDHSTAVIVAKGAPMTAGIVLDPWRKGGVLFWSPVATDTRYKWQEREAVLRKYGRITYVNPDGTPTQQPQ